MNELKQLLLSEPRLTIAVAESMTGGHVQARLTAISGSSNFFCGGITAYTIDQKVKHLGVSRALAKRVNCVSAEVAEQMAAGVCELFGADIGLATTGYAEPAANNAVAQPYAWWAVIWVGPRGKQLSRHGRIECPGASRIDAQVIVAEAAIAELGAFLRELKR